MQQTPFVKTASHIASFLVFATLQPGDAVVCAVGDAVESEVVGATVGDICGCSVGFEV